MHDLVLKILETLRIIVFLCAFFGVYLTAFCWLWQRLRKRTPTHRFGKIINATGPFTAFIALIGLVGLMYGWQIESKQLTTVYYTIPSPKLSPGEKIRIVCLADLHVREQGPREKALPERVRALNPDLIVYPGDFFTHAPHSAAYVERLLQSWSVPQFACRGNRDDIADFDGTLKRAGVIEATSTPCLLTIRKTKLAIVGFPAKPPEEKALSLKSLPNNPFNIVLYHLPDAFPETWGSAADLMVSGHLHGGQIRLPLWGAIFPRSGCMGKWEGGCYEEQGVTLVVSRGLGCQRFMPEIRLLCPPEIVVIDLIGQAVPEAYHPDAVFSQPGTAPRN